MSYTLAYTGAEIDALLGKIDAIFVAEYGSTIYSEVTAAIAAGNKVIVANAGKVYVYAGQDDNSGYVFTQSGPNASKPNATYVTLSTGNVWSTATVDLATLQQFYASLMEDTASGSIASFPDGANGVPVAELSVEIEAQQDLHGQASPYPAGGGKNKLLLGTRTAIKGWNNSGNWSGDVYTNAGLTYTCTFDSDERLVSVKVNGTSTSAATFLVQYGLVADFNGLYLHGAPSEAGANRPLLLYDTNGGAYCTDAGSGVLVQNFVTTGLQIRVRCQAANVSYDNLIYQPIISGSASDAWEPYSNICPISGYTGAEITRAGKNLFDKDAKTSANGYVASHRLDVSGNEVSNGGIHITEYIKVNAGATYTLSGLTGDALAVCAYDKDHNFLEGWTYANNPTKTFTTPANTVYVRFSAIDANEGGYQLETGSTATAYEPYNGTVYSVSWSDEAGTVYGGHFVVNEDGSVDLTVEDALFTPQSISYYGLYGNDNAPLFYATVNTPVKVYGTTSDPAQNKIYSNKYAATDVNTTQALKNFHIRTQSFVASATIFYFRDDRFTSAAEINADLANNPLQIIAVLATPQTYHLDSIGQITTLLGKNVMWSNTGDISVKYRANTALYIEKKLGE